MKGEVGALKFADLCAAQLRAHPGLYGVCRARFVRRLQAGLPLSARNTLCGVRDELLLEFNDHLSPLFARLYALENPEARFRAKDGALVAALQREHPAVFAELARLAGVPLTVQAQLDAGQVLPPPRPKRQNATQPASKKGEPQPRLLPAPEPQ